MSAIRKLSGKLALGPVRHTSSFEVYNHIRVGNDYHSYVKIPGALSTLLRDGQQCTLWMTPLEIPTPFFFKSKACIVYAAEVDGVIHNVTDQVAKGWTGAKWLMVAALILATFVTFFIFIWPLFLINSFRMALVNLPLEEMRRDPGRAPA